MKNSIRLLLLLGSLFLLASSAYAIPSSYDVGTHNTPKWQEQATHDATNDLLSDYGVFWSVDGGLTWGHDDLYVGQSVSFMVNMHKDNVGTHYADYAKTWVDWGQDGTFNNGSDVASYNAQPLSVNENGNYGSNKSPNVPNYTFFSDTFDILDDYVGDLWLLSRVTCSESLIRVDGGKWGDQWATDNDKYNEIFTATANLNQGEYEAHRITVNAEPVPEPATLFLLGSGILGFVGIKRRKK